MSKEEIQILAKRHLSTLQNEAGSILYSSHETLKPGDVYLLGFNPGGEGGYPLLNSIESMLTKQDNAYIDECWDNGNGAWKAGEAPLQKRICWILKELDLNPCEVCSSNLIFFQSKAAVGIDYNLAQKCWPIHEAIINLVKPKLILVFGNSGTSPYRYLHNIFGGREDIIPAGHGDWNAKGFSTEIHSQAVYVAGLPHLSRYDPRGKAHIIEWLRSKVAAY